MLPSLGTLSGVVRSAVTGHPLPEALLSLTDGEGALAASSHADEHGRFYFRDLPADPSYTLTASGYPPAVLAAPLQAGHTDEYTVELGPRPDPSAPG